MLVRRPSFQMMGLKRRRDVTYVTKHRARTGHQTIAGNVSLGRRPTGMRIRRRGSCLVGVLLCAVFFTAAEEAGFENKTIVRIEYQPASQPLDSRDLERVQVL